ncbi:hypothetical protein BKA63DRAFT_601863 [Paraphoma chrysanthemicola]|nr:hypothetical protein BKA63DRAFT_601863 [Paraphoma chrysanthemicola]
MKTQYFSALYLLAATPSLALGQSHPDKEAAASSYHDRVERLRTRNILEAMEVVCRNVDCTNREDGDCNNVGCNICAYDYYCTTLDDSIVLPKPEEMVIIAGASDITGLPVVLTNFLEAGQLRNQWAKHICKEITKVRSDQDFEAGL